MEKFIAFDTETTGLDVLRDDYMFAFSLCDDDGNLEVFRVDKSKREKDKAVKRMNEVFSGKYTVVMFNAKFDIHVAEKFLGRRVRHVPFCDVYIMSKYLQNDHPDHRLKTLAWELGDISTEDEEEIKKYLTPGKKKGYEHVPRLRMDRYASLDSLRTMILHLFWWPMIKKNKNLSRLFNMEMDVIRLTLDMENRGLMLDRRESENLVIRLEQECQEISNKIVEKCGRNINVYKGDDIAWLLFDWCSLPVVSFTPTGKKKVSKDVLLYLKEEHKCTEKQVWFIDSILKLKSYDRGIKIIRDNYLQLVDENDIIHPSINTCAAITLRQSCNNPNLQNVAKEGVLLNPFPVPARRCFRPRVGYINGHVDYSGIELKLLVHYSQDKIMVDHINNGGDPHDFAAQLFYGEKYTECKDPDLKKSLRGAAKNANFGIPYGCSFKKLAKILGVSEKEAKVKFERYGEVLPNLAFLTRILSKEVKQSGYVETVFGNRLYVSREKPYVGTNYLIQGTAAIVLKEAERRFYQYVKENVEDGVCNVLLPIHDEIVFEWARASLPEMKEHLRNIRELMIDFPEFSVPLEVEFTITTTNWQKKKDYSLN